MRTSLALTLSLLLPLAGCGIAKQEYNARLTEITELRAKLGREQKEHLGTRTVAESLKARLRALGQNVHDLEQDRSKLESERGQLSLSLEETKRRMAELEKAHQLAEQRAQQFRSLFAKFKGMIDAGKLKVEIRNGLMLVKLADHILFDPGKTDLKKGGQEALREVAGVLAEIPNRKFQVAGHTDNQALARGSKYKDNWELSTARAVEVVHFLVSKASFPAERLSAAGFADMLPVAANDSDDGRRSNRRIEIVLLPNIEDLPPMDDLK